MPQPEHSVPQRTGSDRRCAGGIFLDRMPPQIYRIPRSRGYRLMVCTPGGSQELRSFRFMSVSSPGGLGHQRIGTSSVRHYPAAAPLGSPSWRPLRNSKNFWLTATNVLHPLSQICRFRSAAKSDSSPRGGAKAASPLGSPGWRPLQAQKFLAFPGANVSPLTSQRMENMEKSLALGVFSTFFCGKQGK